MKEHGGGIGTLRADTPLRTVAQAEILKRLTELEAIREEISGPADSESLHALRIAAKRLRYSLEMFAVCFPDNVALERADTVRAMQDLLGRIHDLDVLHGLLEERLGQIDAEARDRALQVALAPSEGESREHSLLDQTRTDGKADGRLGLYKIIAAKADERRDAYGRFETHWKHWQDSGFLASIRELLAD